MFGFEYYLWTNSVENKIWKKYIIEADPFNTHVYFNSIYIFEPPISVFFIWLLTVLFTHSNVIILVPYFHA